MHLLILQPWPFNPKTTSLLVYPEVIPYTKFEQFGIIRFWAMLRTNEQTDSDTVGMGNKSTDKLLVIDISMMKMTGVARTYDSLSR